MRVFALFVVAVAAVSAVGLEHRNAAANHLEQQVSKSSFGKTVLAQLQAQVTAGAPIDELRSIIAEIRTRLTEAQSADDAQAAQYKTQCESEVAQLNQEIKDLEARIEALKLAIKAKKDDITRIEGEIKTTEDKIAFDEAEIVRINESIDANDAEWAKDHQTFLNRTHDTNLCLEALAEIRAIPGIDEVLAGGQDATAADFQNDNVYTGLLQKAAHKVSAPDVKAFVQLTAAAISQLSKGDVDSLKKLLDDLELDLQNYLVELVEDDKKNQAAYEEKNTALLGELAAANDTLEADKAHLIKLQGDLAQAQTELAALEKDLADTEQELTNTENELVATQQKCADLQQSFLDRSGERVEEQATLDQIEAIIEEKLGGAPEHIGEAVADVSVAE